MNRECFAALSILIAVVLTPVAPTWAQGRSPQNPARGESFLKLPQEFQVLERKAPLDMVVAIRSLTSRLQGADSAEAVGPVAWTTAALAGISKEGFTYGAL